MYQISVQEKEFATHRQHKKYRIVQKIENYSQNFRYFDVTDVTYFSCAWFFLIFGFRRTSVTKIRKLDRLCFGHNRSNFDCVFQSFLPDIRLPPPFQNASLIWCRFVVFFPRSLLLFHSLLFFSSMFPSSLFAPYLFLAIIDSNDIMKRWYRTLLTTQIGNFLQFKVSIFILPIFIKPRHDVTQNVDFQIMALYDSNISKGKLMLRTFAYVRIFKTYLVLWSFGMEALPQFSYSTF